MNRYLLPVEEQLLDVYLNARAQMWGTNHGLPLTWEEWNQIRRRMPVAQNPSINDVLSTVSRNLQSRAASDHALRLAEAAIETEELTRPVISSLSETLKREMFIAERVAFPVHSSLPVHLPERIPNWAWHDGLHVMVPGWWELKESQPTGGQAGAEASTQSWGKAYPPHLQRMLTAPAHAFIDRASRDGRNWKTDALVDPFPYFEDGRTTGLRMTYGSLTEFGTDLQTVVLP